MRSLLPYQCIAAGTPSASQRDAELAHVFPGRPGYITLGPLVKRMYAPLVRARDIRIL